MTRAAVRAAAWIPALAWAGLIFYLSSRSVVPEPPGVEVIPFRDKAEHFVEFGIFAALLLFALRRSPLWRTRIPADFDAHLALMFASAYALTDEIHQAFVPNRRADAADFLVDTLGALVLAFALASYVHGPQQSARPPAGDVRVPEGRLSYIEAGGGPVILYLHGWHGSKRYFEGAPSWLTGYRHVALDLLGFGESDAPRGFSYAPRDQARVVRAFAREVGIDSAILVGHSMGGAIALELALFDPAFVRALVLVEPALNLGVKAPFIMTREDAREMGVGLVRHLRGLNVRPFLHLIVEDPRSLAQPFVDDAMSVPLHVSARALAGLAATHWADRLAAVATPTLLIFGDPSHGVRAAFARRVAESMPAASSVFVAHTSHCPMIEAPADFYGRMASFIEHLGQAGQAAAGGRS